MRWVGSRTHVLRELSGSLYGLSPALHHGIAGALCSRCPSHEFHYGLTLPIHILPAGKQKIFGRSDDIDAINACLEGQRDSACSQPRICVISGMAGVGKTTLAREYVEEHKDDFDIICWIPGDILGMISRHYHDLGRQLRVLGHETPSIQSGDHERVTDWLSNCGKQTFLCC